jgi:hypothetical protein
MHYRRLTNKDWEKIEERIEKKLRCWKGKYLAAGGRLVLINSMLNSLAMFMLSFLKFQMEFLKKLITSDLDSFGSTIVRKRSID